MIGQVHGGGAGVIAVGTAEATGAVSRSVQGSLPIVTRRRKASCW